MKNANWSMPAWMEPYCNGGILMYSKEQVEQYMNTEEDLNLFGDDPLPLIVIETKRNVEFLEKLRSEGTI